MEVQNVVWFLMTGAMTVAILIVGFFTKALISSMNTKLDQVTKILNDIQTTLAVQTEINKKIDAQHEDIKNYYLWRAEIEERMQKQEAIHDVCPNNVLKNSSLPVRQVRRKRG